MLSKRLVTSISVFPRRALHASAVAPSAPASAAQMDLDRHAAATNWPVTKFNTILNVCPQGTMMLVERMGRIHAVQQPGWFIAVPLLDRIRYVVDMRERVVPIVPQEAITRDNVNVWLSGIVAVQFVDVMKAAYGSANPLMAIRQHAEGVVRSAIGEMELDEAFHDRRRLNTIIREAIQPAAQPWGIRVMRYEVLNLVPDERISVAMDRQAAAERERREKVIQAEAERRAMELRSEGQLIKVRNEAEAEKTRLQLEAEGAALATERRADAEARAVAIIASALRQEGGKEAAALALARQYVEMYGQLGVTSNTMIFSDRPAGDATAMLAQAAAVWQGTTKHLSKQQD